MPNLPVWRLFPRRRFPHLGAHVRPWQLAPPAPALWGSLVQCPTHTWSSLRLLHPVHFPHLHRSVCPLKTTQNTHNTRRKECRGNRHAGCRPRKSTDRTGWWHVHKKFDRFDDCWLNRPPLGKMREMRTCSRICWHSTRRSRYFRQRFVFCCDVDVQFAVLALVRGLSGCSGLLFWLTVLAWSAVCLNSWVPDARKVCAALVLFVAIERRRRQSAGASRRRYTTGYLLLGFSTLPRAYLLINYHVFEHFYRFFVWISLMY